MSEFRRKLNEHIRLESRRQLVSIGVIVVFVGFFTLYDMPKMGAVRERTGVALRVAGVPSVIGNKSLLIVRLDSGEEVRTSIDTVSQFQRGKTARLAERSALFFGAPTYQFRGYVDDGSSR
ncbi:MAG: hypothetical protein AAGA11_11550 [Pseudomonadota bacterium]